MAKYNYRCSDRNNCGKRVRLGQPIDHYVKRPHCPECKKDSLKPTHYDTIYYSSITCHCSGIGWPHRKGAILNAYATCENADPDKVEELDFNTEIGVKESTVCDPSGECPF